MLRWWYERPRPLLLRPLHAPSPIKVYSDCIAMCGPVPPVTEAAVVQDHAMRGFAHPLGALLWFLLGGCNNYDDQCPVSERSLWARRVSPSCRVAWADLQDYGDSRSSSADTDAGVQGAGAVSLKKNKQNKILKTNKNKQNKY